MEKLRSRILLAAAAYFALAAMADEPKEYFGRFSGEPKLEVKSNAEGRPTFVLVEDFYFEDPNGLSWAAPQEWEVDGASIPKVAWSIVGGPLSGRYLHASIIHDYYFETRTAHDTHRSFYYGMLAKDVSKLKAKLMYFAVRTFGPNWKVVREPIISGMTGSAEFVWLNTMPISAPSLSSEDAQKLIESLDENLDIDQLDQLSDSVRISAGSEALQRELPELTAKEKRDVTNFMRNSLPPPQ